MNRTLKELTRAQIAARLAADDLLLLCHAVSPGRAESAARHLREAAEAMGFALVPQ